MRNIRCLTLIEFLVMLCILLILLGTFAGYANIVLKAARETALQNELMNIRMSIEYYRVINGKVPQDLFALVNKDFTLKSPDGIILPSRFLESFRVDKEGYLLDPFMNRYDYDNQMGLVRSQTKGHGGW